MTQITEVLHKNNYNSDCVWLTTTEIKCWPKTNALSALYIGLNKNNKNKQQQKLLPPNAAEREVLAKWIFYNNKYETAFEKNKLEICA